MKCEQCYEETKDSYYRENENETVCEDCYVEWLGQQHDNKYKGAKQMSKQAKTELSTIEKAMIVIDRQQNTINKLESIIEEQNHRYSILQSVVGKKVTIIKQQSETIKRLNYDN